MEPFRNSDCRGFGRQNIASVRPPGLHTLYYANTCFSRWNPDRPNVKYSTELKGHAAAIEKVAFNPVKDAELCSVSSDGVVKFWDVRTKAVINEVKGLGDAFTLAWNPDGESLVVGNKVCCSTLDAMLCSNRSKRFTSCTLSGESSERTSII
jgi:THO complex subunit 3